MFSWIKYCRNDGAVQGKSLKRIQNFSFYVMCFRAGPNPQEAGPHQISMISGWLQNFPTRFSTELEYQRPKHLGDCMWQSFGIRKPLPRRKFYTVYDAEKKRYWAAPVQAFVGYKHGFVNGFRTLGTSRSKVWHIKSGFSKANKLTGQHCKLILVFIHFGA